MPFRYFLLGVVLASSMALGAVKTEYHAKYGFSANALVPNQSLTMTVDLDKPLEVEPGEFELTFYIKPASNPPDTAGFFVAKVDVKAMQMSKLGTFWEVPLEVVTPTRLVVSDIRLNQWLPSGGYIVEPMRITTSNPGLKSQIGTITSPWTDDLGRVLPGVAPAFSLTGTDPDSVAPYLDSLVFTAPEQDGVPTIEEGERAHLRAAFEDNKSGVWRVEVVLTRVERTERGFRQANLGSNFVSDFCEIEGLPLKGELECDLAVTKTLEPGLYAAALASLYDRRLWSLEDALAWFAPIDEFSSAVGTSHLEGTTLEHMGGLPESGSMMYWKDQGRSLEIPLPVIQIVPRGTAAVRR